MLFDKLCKMVERNIDNTDMKLLKSILEKTKLFYMDAVPHEVLPSSISEPEYLTEYFFLPFKSTAMEDKASLTIIVDKVENQKGLLGSRFFIHVQSPYADIKNFNDDESIKPEVVEMQNLFMEKFGDSCLMVTIGELHSITFESNSRFLANGNLISSIIVSKTVVHELGSNETIRESILKNVMTSMQELFLLNCPDSDTWVVEQRELQNKNKKSKTDNSKIKRSYERPIHVLMKTVELKKIMGEVNRIEGQKHNSPIVHERRRHRRFLKDDRYRFDATGKAIEPKLNYKGELYYKEVDVPAVWVGKSETIVGNRKYKIMLNI